MLTAYHKILGVEEDASLSDIKSAYRKLAKAFHPDINKSEGAESVFIRINEAYEYLLHENEYGRTKHGKVYSNYREKMYKEWVKTNQASARDRARSYAAMNYRTYKKSILDESPLTFYGIKMAGCLTTAVILLIVIFIVALFSTKLALFIALLALPVAALLMTIGEKYLKMDEVLKWFK